MPEDENSISRALEQLALSLGEAGAVPRAELIRALERTAERLRARTSSTADPIDLVSQSEAARLVGVSRQAVHQWVRKGLLETYDNPEPNGRRAPMVSLGDISVAANRWQAEPFSSVLRQQLGAFLELIAKEPLVAPIAEAIATALDAGPTDEYSGHAARVLREFLVAAMGVEGSRQEFTPAGVRMLAELRPQIVVDTTDDFGRLLDTLGLLICSSAGAAGFDSASAALLGLLGAATVGSFVDDAPCARLGESIAASAAEVWGDGWVHRLFDAAYHTDELLIPPMTRYPAPLVYLGCNLFMRQAQADGVSITYAKSPGAILPQSYHGGPVMTEILAGHRHGEPPWQFERGSEAVRAALQRSAKSPFRIFNFDYGLFDDSIHGIRRYCFSMARARDELRDFMAGLPAGERAKYLALAVETLAGVLQKPYVEVTAVEPPAEFDWWKDHIIRSSKRETLIGLRGERARSTAHGLLVRSSVLPQVLAAGDEDSELRERLRIYVRNLSFDITDERYLDDLRRGVTRVIKKGSETLTPEQAQRLAGETVHGLVS